MDFQKEAWIRASLLFDGNIRVRAQCTSATLPVFPGSRKRVRAS